MCGLNRGIMYLRYEYFQGIFERLFKLFSAEIMGNGEVLFLFSCSKLLLGLL